MTITYEPRAGDARALVVALGLGGLIGLAIGGAYLAGGIAREAVSKPLISQANHVQIPAQAGVGPEAAAGQGALYPNGLSSGEPTPGPQKSASLRDRFSLALGFGLARSGAPPFHAQAADSQDHARDTQCLAQAVYYEARGESPSGQAAVAQVVLNRLRHPAFPKTVCGVVFQHAGADCQFSFACNGAMRQPLDRVSWGRALAVADRALSGKVMAEVGAATHFQAVRSGTGWAGSLAKVAQIGEHIFYRFSGRGGATHLFHAEPQRSDPGADAQISGDGARVHTVFRLAAAGDPADAKAAESKAAPSETAAAPTNLPVNPVEPKAKPQVPAPSADIGSSVQPVKATEPERSQPITTSATPS